MSPTKSKSPSSSRGAPSPSKASIIGSDLPKTLGWTAQDKSALFAHVRKVGETKWGDAVPGKTSKQVSITAVAASVSVENTSSQSIREWLTHQSSEQWK